MADANFGKKQPRDDPFGQRYLRDEGAVFEYNAWDDVDWSEEKEAEIQQTIKAQMASPVPENVALDLLENPRERWEAFFEKHNNKFFMDRKWLAREFPELYETNGKPLRVLDVGCGVGNTTIPLLESNSQLFLFSCDFSFRAIETLRNDKRNGSGRCEAFVWDITEQSTGNTFPIAPDSLDFVLCIFVLSAIRPDRLVSAVQNLAKLLRPGGMLLMKDYGRHDLTQLRFKSERFIQSNFYQRGDGTLVKFFTPEELHELFTGIGLEKVQNFMDKRLVVNRAKRVKMYRRWIQCKYVKKTM